jgi:hypothetical protein
MYLRVEMPAIKETGIVLPWLAGLTFGHALISSVEIEIGGQKIDKHYGEWLHIWNELTQSAGHALGYNSLIGNHPTFTVPKSGGVTVAGDNAPSTPR